MDHAELTELLERLIATWENEVVEFKEASNDYDTDKIGKYFSALANEANLRGLERGWLVFGVSNKTRQVVGTNYRPEHDRLQNLKHQMTQGTDPRVTFRHIHELHQAEGRVVLFEVPAAPSGMPVAWQGHYYARAGENLTSLGLDKLDDIRGQALTRDWTAQIVPGATLADLDEEAVRKAREGFAHKYANRFSKDEVDSWPLATFLDRARVTRDGRITRTALLLLGKAESAHHLSPHMVQMTWRLEGPERAYEHFGPPFLINSTALYQRIRNIQLRILPPNQLLPVEVSKYDRKLVLEALHNCIAHQDYFQNARIVVTERLDRLEFESVGSFFEGQPDDYIQEGRIPQRYRNPFLTKAMAELNMIDTMGYGIHSIYVGQAKRYFPLPDYDLSRPGVVKMTLYGGVIDTAYSELLAQRTDLPLSDILALDRVQKKLPIPAETAAKLRKAGLIEGRKPNYFVSAQVAQATASKADYIRTRAFDDEYYAKLLMGYLEEFGEATRADINQLLLDKLSDALDDKQRASKINTLLTKWRRAGLIVNQGSDRASRWVLAERE